MTEIALITGANKGIGFATARSLGARGMTVLLGSRDGERGQAAERTLRGEGIDAHAVQLDVTDSTSVRKVAEWIDAEYGRLDILVNNAGIARADGTWLPSETTIETMRTVYETNVFGVVAVINAMLPLLRRSEHPRIVNQSSHVASLTLQTTPDVDLGGVSGSYSPSKTFLNAVTIQYAKELSDTAIKINNACPGYVATDLNGFHGTSTPPEGAKIAIRLATLPDDGPTGGLFDDAGNVPW
jgi:NAD(P)-dependent dehydrogenase (short-subunit alcohol dehydrogenase family)